MPWGGGSLRPALLSRRRGVCPERLDVGLVVAAAMTVPDRREVRSAFYPCYQAVRRPLNLFVEGLAGFKSP